MKHLKGILPTALALLLALSPVAAAEGDGQESISINPAPPAAYDAQMGELLHGTWIGRLHTPIQPVENLTYFEDPAELNFIDEQNEPRLLVTIQSYVSSYTLPRTWQVSDGEVRITVGERPWQAEMILRLDGENTLLGTYTQYGKEYETAFYRTSYAPKRLDKAPQFLFEGEGSDVWYERLRKHTTFTGTGAALPFTYELYAWEKNRPLIDSVPGMMSLAYSDYASDTERMLAIMNALCDTYAHDGASGMPDATDTLSVMQYAQANGAIECRGLSAMLSELLRAFGIPAKPVMCIPYTDPCEDCHVVVHAWSNDLNQWVMLDPTYRLMLQDGSGNYLSIPQVRDALANGDPLRPNGNAGHNGTPFSIEYYRAYMAKNMFRFSSLEKSVFEGEKVEGGNLTHMLVPQGWQLPYEWSRPEKVTYNPDAFWASPFNEQ